MRWRLPLLVCLLVYLDPDNSPVIKVCGEDN